MSVSVYENAGNLRGQRHQLPRELELDDCVGARNQNTYGSARSAPTRKTFLLPGVTTPIILQFRSQLISSKPIQNYLVVTQQDSISEKLRSKDVAHSIVLIYNM